MLLVHQSERNAGKWKVAWVWMPHFLAIDRELHKFVDQGMTKAFKGQSISDDPDQAESVVKQMHDEVIRLILKKYDITGLRPYLEAIADLNPEEVTSKESGDGLQQ